VRGFSRQIILEKQCDRMEQVAISPRFRLNYNPRPEKIRGAKGVAYMG
jgi:hypothetical protein